MSGDLKEVRRSGRGKLQAEETARAKALGWELVARASGKARKPNVAGAEQVLRTEDEVKRLGGVTSVAHEGLGGASTSTPAFTLNETGRLWRALSRGVGNKV